MKYLAINGELAFNNGKLIPIDGSGGTSEDVTDLVTEQITYVDQSTNLTAEIESLVDSLNVENPQEKTVTPSVVAQEVTPDEGFTCLSKVNVEAVTSAIDSNITAENIKKDVSILGVVGTLESGGSGEDLVNGIIDRSITNIESNVTSIGDSAFSRCSALASATFPNATSIGNSAFNNCSTLTSTEYPKANCIVISECVSC